MYQLYALLFDEFEILDLCGPVEMLGQLKNDIQLHYISLTGGPIVCSQGATFITDPPPTDFLDKEDSPILLIPGGRGTRKEVNNQNILELISKMDKNALFVLTVCTGSALLAATGLLDGKKATSNKNAFTWVMEQGTHVQWAGDARWTQDGKYFTASGISAGLDMALGFINHLFGSDTAEAIAARTEYIWNRDSTYDPFAVTFK